MPSLAELLPDEPRVRAAPAYERREVGAVKRSGNTAVVVAELLEPGSGAVRYVDIRMYYYDRGARDWKPTKKGLTVPPEAVPALAELLGSGAAESRRGGSGGV
ncbi:MAG: transcriptional coactivator p15/PC4 family protein [Moorellales bacterium]